MATTLISYSVFASRPAIVRDKLLPVELHPQTLSAILRYFILYLGILELEAVLPFRGIIDTFRLEESWGYPTVKTP